MLSGNANRSDSIDYSLPKNREHSEEGYDRGATNCLPRNTLSFIQLPALNLTLFLLDFAVVPTNILG